MPGGLGAFLLLLPPGAPWVADNTPVHVAAAKVAAVSSVAPDAIPGLQGANPWTPDLLPVPAQRDARTRRTAPTATVEALPGVVVVLAPHGFDVGFAAARPPRMATAFVADAPSRLGAPWVGDAATPNRAARTSPLSVSTDALPAPYVVGANWGYEPASPVTRAPRADVRSIAGEPLPGTFASWGWEPSWPSTRTPVGDRRGVNADALPAPYVVPSAWAYQPYPVPAKAPRVPVHVSGDPLPNVALSITPGGFESSAWQPRTAVADRSPVALALAGLGAPWAPEPQTFQRSPRSAVGYAADTFPAPYVLGASWGFEPAQPTTRPWRAEARPLNAEPLPSPYVVVSTWVGDSSTARPASARPLPISCEPVVASRPVAWSAEPSSPAVRAPRGIVGQVVAEALPAPYVVASTWTADASTLPARTSAADRRAVSAEAIVASPLVAWTCDAPLAGKPLRAVNPAAAESLPALRVITWAQEPGYPTSRAPVVDRRSVSADALPSPFVSVSACPGDVDGFVRRVRTPLALPVAESTPTIVVSLTSWVADVATARSAPLRQWPVATDPVTGPRAVAWSLDDNVAARGGRVIRVGAAGEPLPSPFVSVSSWVSQQDAAARQVAPLRLPHAVELPPLGIASWVSEQTAAPRSRAALPVTQWEPLRSPVVVAATWAPELTTTPAARLTRPMPAGTEPLASTSRAWAPESGDARRSPVRPQLPNADTAPATAAAPLVAWTCEASPLSKPVRAPLTLSVEPPPSIAAAPLTRWAWEPLPPAKPARGQAVVSAVVAPLPALPVAPLTAWQVAEVVSPRAKAPQPVVCDVAVGAVPAPWICDLDVARSTRARRALVAVADAYRSSAVAWAPEDTLVLRRPSRTITLAASDPLPSFVAVAGWTVDAIAPRATARRQADTLTIAGIAGAATGWENAGPQLRASASARSWSADALAAAAPAWGWELPHAASPWRAPRLLPEWAAPLPTISTVIVPRPGFARATVALVFAAAQGDTIIMSATPVSLNTGDAKATNATTFSASSNASSVGSAVASVALVANATGSDTAI